MEKTPQNGSEMVLEHFLKGNISSWDPPIHFCTLSLTCHCIKSYCTWEDILGFSMISHEWITFSSWGFKMAANTISMCCGKKISVRNYNLCEFDIQIASSKYLRNNLVSFQSSVIIFPRLNKSWIINVLCRGPHDVTNMFTYCTHLL